MLKTLLASCAICASALVAQADPNILFILADDMGRDASRCYSVGRQQAPMPNLEALCKKGMVFDNAYSAPVCSPTRATILTGLYGFRTGVEGNVTPRSSKGLSSNVKSLFDVFSRTRYKTNLIGKWHLGTPAQGPSHPKSLGVSAHFGIMRGTVRSYSDWPAVDRGRSMQMHSYTTTEFTDRAIAWIGAQQDPWFLWLAYNAPHKPFHRPPSGLHRFDNLADSAAQARQNPVPYYKATLEALDTELGRLLKSMPPDTRDNTIIIFAGDNGTPEPVARSVYGRHRAKGTLYEGGIHIPLVVTGPGIKRGRSKDFVFTTDLFPTIAGLAGIKAQTPDSFDFRPVLRGGSGQRDHIYVEHHASVRSRQHEVNGRTLRVGSHKLVEPENGTARLYDLQSDPFENRDLLADGVTTREATLVASLRDRMRGIR